MFDVLVNDLGFPEGPVPLPDGSIAFVDLLHAKVRRFKDGKVEVLAELPGAPNGMRMGPDGTLYIANNGGLAPKNLHELNQAENMISGRVHRLTLDGALRDVVTDLEGEGPWRPNDLIFTEDNRILFTDPQNWEDISSWDDPNDIPGYAGGRIFLGNSDGSARKLCDLYGFPNGLQFHPDGSLIVGLTLKQRLVRFPWDGENLGEPELWVQFEDGTAPDGLLFHDGIIYAAGSVGDRVVAIDADGKIIKKYETGVGSDPTNLCVIGDRLYVTLGIPGKLVSFPL